MDELRWILVLLGSLIVASIYFWGKPKVSKSSRDKEEPIGIGSIRADKLDPDLFSRQLNQLGNIISGNDSDLVSNPPDPQETVVPGQGVDANPQKLVLLHIKSHHSSSINGPKLWRAAEKAGLTFGAMEIFHRLHEGNKQSPPLFSVSNMIKPGTFDDSAIHELNTPGLTLFMALPGPIPALDVFDAMLATGQRLAELLDSDLLDESHSAMGRQGIQHLRDQMRQYDRKQLSSTA